MNSSFSCNNTTTQFAKGLTELYLSTYPGANSKKVQTEIKNWLTNGTKSNTIRSLFTVDEQRYFPIWWSGFYVEDPNNKTNPIQNMKNAAKVVNGYSSLNVPLSTKFNNQSLFWTACSKEKLSNFKWGVHLSIMYTTMALRHNPTHIGLYLNKDSIGFVNSFFFKTELGLIYEHYKKIGKSVVLHIFNLQDNCSDIENIIKNKVKSANNSKSYITIVCKKCEQHTTNGKVNTLSSCIRRRTTRVNKGIVLNNTLVNRANASRKNHGNNNKDKE